MSTINCRSLLLSLAEMHIERTSVVGSSNVQSIGMHKKSIEASKALNDEDGGCDDGEADSSESGPHPHLQSLPVSLSTPVVASLDRRQPPATGCESADSSAGVGGGTGGGGTEDVLRSESIAALRAKV